MLSKSTYKPHLFTGILVFLISLLFGSYVIWQIHEHHKQSEMSAIASLLTRHGIQLEQHIRQGMAVNELLGVMIQTDINQLDNFEVIAENLLKISPSLSHFSLAPNGLIEKVFPTAGNEASIGFNFLQDPEQGPDALKAKSLNQQYISGPLNLVQGGLAYILRYPIYLKHDQTTDDEVFWGFSSIIIRLDTLFEVSGFELLNQEGVNFQFVQAAPETMPKLVFSSEGDLSREVVKYDLDLPNGDWFLVASPEKGWVDRDHIVIESIPILFVCALLGLFAMQVQRIKAMNKNLETAVNDRTKELQVAAIAFQSQNGILVTDNHYRIIKVNEAFENITGYNEVEVIGNNPSILNSGLHDKAFYKRMYTDLRTKGCWQGEIWNRRKSGDIYPEYLTITAIRGQDDKVSHFVASLVDLTELKATQEKVHQLQYFDSLTNLPNRNQLKEIMIEVVNDSDTGVDQICGFILFLDLDHFKQLNDALGQATGDQLLLQVSQRLNECLPRIATLSRLGSDEFVVLVQLTDSNEKQAASAAEEMSESLIAHLSEPFRVFNQSHRITASVGVTLIRSQADPDEVLKEAELAMFQAKSKGRNRIYFYEQSMQSKAIQRLELKAEMYEALQTDAFELYYQPQFDGSFQIKGVEALIRWEHPTRGMIPPNEFIPLAEENDLILKIGEWVLHASFIQSVKWSDSTSTQDITISVNVSAKQFAQPDFVEHVREILQKTGANPNKIQLELTESMLINDTQDIIDKMIQLKRLGLLLSLDDFGTGYSSLSYLQKLPIDQLKVDQAFVWDINPHDPQRSLASTIVAMGLSLDLEVIAEGIETQKQLEFLKSIGCELFQGYLLAKPMKATEIKC